MTQMINTQKHKKFKKYYTDYVFLQNRKATEMEKLSFCVITFEPIRACLANQNVRLNLSFVKVL